MEPVPGAASLRRQDGDDLIRRLRYLVIDHHVVVVGNLPVLLPGLLEPALNDLLLIGGPAVQPAGKLFKSGRDNKNQHCLRALGADLGRTLHLNVQQYVDARVQLLLDDLERGAVVVAHILGILQKLLPGDHPFKGFPADEIVIHTVGLTHPGLPGGEGDGEIDVAALTEQLGDHRALSHARGAGQNDQLSARLFLSYHSISSSGSGPVSFPASRPATVSG